MEDEEEMQKLRALYDELWQDARTMIRDMKESMSMYLFAGLMLLAYTFVTISAALGGSLKLLIGSTDFFDYFTATVGIFGTIFFILLGLRLIRWYYKLKKRYAKLLKMEKAIED